MFIIEGLVYYLPPEAFKQSLTSISETAVAGSRLFFDFLHLESLSNEVLHPGLETLLMVRPCKQAVVLLLANGIVLLGLQLYPFAKEARSPTEEQQCAPLRV